MAKKQRASTKKPKGGAKRKKWSAERGRTIQEQRQRRAADPRRAGAGERVTIGEAMRLAVEKLGDVTIDNEFAPKQLREIGEIARRRRAAPSRLRREVRRSEDREEVPRSATELLLERARAFTHPTPMPLFDHVQEEDDRAEMVAGGDVEELGVQEATA
jgi:hypothetical protein